jgi:hypothetical protein
MQVINPHIKKSVVKMINGTVYLPCTCWTVLDPEGVVTIEAIWFGLIGFRMAVNLQLIPRMTSVEKTLYMNGNSEVGAVLKYNACANVQESFTDVLNI